MATTEPKKVVLAIDSLKGCLSAAEAEAAKLNLYSDPESKILTETAAKLFGVSPSQMLMTNGSDEILNFAFMAFCDTNRPVVFPSVTYGFYPVFAKLNNIPSVIFSISFACN